MIIGPEGRRGRVYHSGTGRAEKFWWRGFFVGSFLGALTGAAIGFFGANILDLWFKV